MVSSGLLGYFSPALPLSVEEIRQYSGHQVRATRAVALLKGRGWTVDHEEGLQKVCYGEGVIVRMYAMADWFSPSDVEELTLETIRFFGRASGEPIELESVSPVLFSEVMRVMTERRPTPKAILLS